MPFGGGAGEEKSENDNNILFRFGIHKKKKKISMDGKRKHGWMDGWIHGYFSIFLYKRMATRIYIRMGGWMDGWINFYMHRLFLLVLLTDDRAPDSNTTKHGVKDREG